MLQVWGWYNPHEPGNPRDSIGPHGVPPRPAEGSVPRTCPEDGRASAAALPPNKADLDPLQVVEGPKRSSKVLTVLACLGHFW